MEKKVVFSLLILCGLVSRGFCISSEENEKSSDPHIRKKRLVGRGTVREAVPFLVNLNANGVNHCPATLLTFSIALTSAQCFRTPSPRWEIQYDSHVHEIVHVIPAGSYNEAQPTVNNLHLIYFSPAINSRLTRHRPISIFTGNLSSIHSDLEIYNWQHLLTREGERRQSVSQVQVVKVRLISNDHCQNYYPGRIGPRNFCAQSVNTSEYCQNVDTGAPVVVNNQLVGIFAFRGENCQGPHVFMNLHEPAIKEGLLNYIPSLRFYWE